MFLLGEFCVFSHYKVNFRRYLGRLHADTRFGGRRSRNTPRHMDFRIFNAPTLGFRVLGLGVSRWAKASPPWASPTLCLTKILTPSFVPVINYLKCSILSIWVYCNDI